MNSSVSGQLSFNQLLRKSEQLVKRPTGTHSLPLNIFTNIKPINVISFYLSKNFRSSCRKKDGENIAVSLGQQSLPSD